MNKEAQPSSARPYPILRSAEGHLRLGSGTLDENIRYCVRAIVLMRRGENLLEPTLGSTVRDFLFRPFTSAVTSDISNGVKEALRTSEPRIEVLTVETRASSDDRSRAAVTVQYRIRESQKVERLDVDLAP